MTETRTWRDGFLRVCPKWLLGKNGYAFVTCVGLMFDLIGTWYDLGIRARFPGVNHNCTPLIGRARKVKRGPNEPDDVYEMRLRYWRQIRRRGGNPFALLEQLQLLFYPSRLYCRVIADNGTRYSLTPGGWQYTITGYDPLTAPAGAVVTDLVGWNWDGTIQPTRFWVLLYSPDTWPSGAAFGSDLTFSDPGTVDDGGTIGSTGTPDDIAQLLSLLRDDNLVPPHSRPQQVILCFDQASFDNITPGGNWDKPWERDPGFEFINV